MKTKVLVPYIVALVGFPLLALFSYAYGFIYSDLISVIWLTVLFEIMIGTLFFMHLVYNHQERSVVIIAHPKESHPVHEKEVAC